jgi:hypothetical protein
MSYHYGKDMGPQYEAALKVARARYAEASMEENIAAAAVKNLEDRYGSYLFGESDLFGHTVEFIDYKDKSRRMVVAGGSFGSMESGDERELILEGKVYLANGKLSKEPWRVPASGARDLGKPEQDS